jgi:hypothetical protein
MNSASCASPLPTTTLLAYWLGEDVASEAVTEEHLMACAHCSQRLEALARVGRGLRDATRGGRIHGVFDASFVKTLQADGLRVREYHLEPGGSVACTVAPDDDLVVSHLHASLRGVTRLDLLFDDVDAGQSWRLADVAFDPEAGEVVLAPNTLMLRALDRATLHARLVAVQGEAEREVGRYTFNHSRFVPEG